MFTDKIVCFVLKEIECLQSETVEESIKVDQMIAIGYEVFYRLRMTPKFRNLQNAILGELKLNNKNLKKQSIRNVRTIMILRYKTVVV